MSSPPVVAAYVTGHGYGHFTRSSAVLERVARAATVHLRTSGSALGLAAPFAATVSEADVGPGVVQRGPLAIDVAATRVALGRHLDAWPLLVEEEAAWLRAIGARLVYGDVPPLAFAAAARAGVPSVALTNFTWSWTYEEYAGDDPWFAAAARRLADAEARASCALTLDGGGGLEMFSRRIAIPPVARRPKRTREETRALLGLDDARPVVLASFGGFGAEIDLVAAVRRQAYRVLLDGRGPGTLEPSPDVPHHELIAAADCVVGKPGYSTFAECLTARTPFVYVPRPGFREAPALVAAIERWLPSAPLSVEDLVAGRWSHAIDRALPSRPPEEPPSGDGALAAADAMQEWLAP